MNTIDVFRMVASEFSAMSDETVLAWINLTSPLLSKKIYGKLYDQALAYLTAHRLKLAGKGENQLGSLSDALGVNSYSEGSTSISFKTPSTTELLSEGSLTMTTYGIEYLRIRRMVVIPIRCAGEVQ